MFAPRQPSTMSVSLTKWYEAVLLSGDHDAASISPGSGKIYKSYSILGTFSHVLHRTLMKYSTSTDEDRELISLGRVTGGEGVGSSVKNPLRVPLTANQANAVKIRMAEKQVIAFHANLINGAFSKGNILSGAKSDESHAASVVDGVDDNVERSGLGSLSGRIAANAANRASNRYLSRMGSAVDDMLASSGIFSALSSLQALGDSFGPHADTEATRERTIEGVVSGSLLCDTLRTLALYLHVFSGYGGARVLLPAWLLVRLFAGQLFCELCSVSYFQRSMFVLVCECTNPCHGPVHQQRLIILSSRLAIHRRVRTTQRVAGRLGPTFLSQLCGNPYEGQ